MRFLKNALVAATAFALCAAPALAADNYTVKDSSGSTITICSKDQGSSVQATCHYGVAGENHIGEVGGHAAIVGANFTTTGTTTALSDGQLLANSGTAGSVTPLDFATACRVSGGTGMVRRARIKIPDTGLAGKSLYLKLYRDSPTVTNGDHGTWLSTESNYIGQISVTLDQHFSDPFEKGSGVPVNGSELNFDCATTHLYGLLVANGASTTLQGSKVATVVLEILQN